MKLSMRQYKNENDYWNIRAFLRKVFMANGRMEYSWQPSRLDYWRWHCVGGLQQHSSVADVTFIWENGQGEIAAVLNPEGRAEAFLQIHPQYKSRELEEEMILMAEEKLAGQSRRAKSRKDTLYAALARMTTCRSEAGHLGRPFTRMSL